MSTKTAKLPDQRKSVSDSMLDHESGLYRHKKRPQWGVAILAWEKGNRRAYQFEDGKLRKFKKGYYSLLEPAEEVRGSPEVLTERLERAVEANKGKEPDRKPQEAAAPFEAQVELFEQLYPEGFNDPKWIDDHRGGEGRALKRHRDPVIEKARSTLAKDAVEEMISEERYGDLVDAVLELLSSTSLVPLKSVKTLRRVEGDERRELAVALAGLLHGEDAFDLRFKRYLAALRDVLGGRPSWRLATCLPAVMFPDEHVSVRRSAFMRQAGSIAPMARYTKKARVGSYRNFQRMALAVRDKLREAGHEPRDLLDVHDFIWATLRNSALEHLGSSK